MRLSRLSILATLALLPACVHRAPVTDAHAGHDMSPAAMPMAAGASSMMMAMPSDTNLPAGASDVVRRLTSSPRHGEWVMIAKRPGATDSIRAWVVYPERSTRAPVVVVIQEIFGNTSWLRGVADQLAREGYIAIAPDLFTGKLSPSAADTLSVQPAIALTQTLVADEVQQQIEATARYGMSLPAALPKYGVVGFCWGGGTSFQQAVRSPAGLGAAVVYYGTSPKNESLPSVRVPVLGLYGGNDARVNMTIAPADSVMRSLGKSYEHSVFEGAGHGFLRAQDGQNGANLAATRQAWPMTIAFFRRNLGA